MRKQSAKSIAHRVQNRNRRVAPSFTGGAKRTPSAVNGDATFPDESALKR